MDELFLATTSVVSLQWTWQELNFCKARFALQRESERIVNFSSGIAWPDQITEVM